MEGETRDFSLPTLTNVPWPMRRVLVDNEL
jgi:hypothetical protein